MATIAGSGSKQKTQHNPAPSASVLTAGAAVLETKEVLKKEEMWLRRKLSNSAMDHKFRREFSQD